MFNPGSSPFGSDRVLRQAFSSDNLLTTIQEGDLVSAAAVPHVKNTHLHVVKNPEKKISAAGDRHMMSTFYERALGPNGVLHSQFCKAFWVRLL